MQFVANSDSSTRHLSKITLYHDHHALHWNVDHYNRSNLKDIRQLFTNINNYIETLSLKDQSQLFSYYFSIKEALVEVRNHDELDYIIKENIQGVYKILKFDQLKAWSYTHAKIHIPFELKDSCDDVDNELTRKLTYLKKEYYDLVILSLLLRPLIPIFGEYIFTTRNEISPKFKEHYTLPLIDDELYDLPAFERLKEYVYASTEKEQVRSPSTFVRDSAIFGGLGTSELPDWLLSKVIIRKLVVQEEMSGDSMIANIFHYISQQISSLDKTFNGRVGKKKSFTINNEEDKVSVAENYKVKQTISDGDLTVISVYMEEPHKVAFTIDPTYNPELLDQCLTLIYQYPDLPIGILQITLSQWVLSKAIPARSVSSLNKKSLMNGVAITQALLWHWGSRELALLLVSEPSQYASMAAGKSSTRLNTKYTNYFFNHYPYYQQHNNTNNKKRNLNVACKAIDILEKELIKYDWYPKGPQKLLEEHQVLADISYIIPAEIKFHIADVLIKLHQLNT